MYVCELKIEGTEENPTDTIVVNRPLLELLEEEKRGGDGRLGTGGETLLGFTNSSTNTN